MSVLVISEKDKEDIGIAVRLARANPTPWEELSKVAEGTPTPETKFDEERAKLADEIYKKYPTQSFLLGTIRVVFNFEYQPAGLFRHLSCALSHKKGGKVPSYEAVKRIALEFGFTGWPPKNAYRVWAEEFEPGRYAVNVIELEEARGDQNALNSQGDSVDKP